MKIQGEEFSWETLEKKCEGLGSIPVTEQDPVVDFCEYDNEPSGSMTGEEFLHKNSD